MINKTHKMENKMKHIVKGIALVLAMVAPSVQAVPTLYFDGGIEYTSGDQELSVSGVLIETQDISPEPLTIGSTFNFSALLDSIDTIAGVGFFGVDSTKGNFISNTPLSDDLEIFDGNSNLLLSADFSSLSLEGANDGNRGAVVGLLVATGGSLMSLFDGGDLFALQLNLTTSFSDSMYEFDFSGNVDGNIQGEFATIPEPSSLALLGLGFLIIAFTRSRKSKI